MKFSNPKDTVCALSTPQGTGAIALIRLSGSRSFEIIDSIFSKSLTFSKSHSLHFGTIKNGEEVLDEVLVTIFRNPKSFTGEDMIEIACHGSQFIQQQVLSILIEKGARLAGPGEFSLRAFLNGKMDLSQAEAVADLIATSSVGAHKMAMYQMRGGFSSEIGELRQELLNFASLIELELDFSEEDVEFADRRQLEKLLSKIERRFSGLIDSFKYGNVIKNGVPVAIVGTPNAGKSTLLNSLLNEDKVIVSEIAGTTRDVIEDTIVLDGILFRFIDTAGIRETSDQLENQGIRKAFEKIKAADIILLLFDLHETDQEEIIRQMEAFKKTSVKDEQSLICLFNKTDQVKQKDYPSLKGRGHFISAKKVHGIEKLKKTIVTKVHEYKSTSNAVVSNVRHYEILGKCQEAIQRIKTALGNEVSGDLLALDIREALNLLGEITGEITSDDLLGNIFANFCIGK